MDPEIDRDRKNMMSEVFSVFLLWFIQRKPCSGYAIVKRISDDKMKASYSQVYPILNRLNRKGFLKMVEKKTGRRVEKVYHITPNGAAFLRKAKAAMPKLKKEFLEYMVS